jgi:hypothetical protein
MFEGLLSNNDYQIKATYTYDLNDGAGGLVSEITVNIKTLLFFGQGTFENPFQIYTFDDLNNVRNELGSNFILMNNIDMNNNEWTPIGQEQSSFIGMFDGGNFIISNIKITNSHKYFGLFGHSSGIVKNIKLNNISINSVGIISHSTYGGSLIGYNNGSVENIYVINAEINILKNSESNNNFAYVGGIIGFNSATINNLVFNGLLNGGEYTGGIVGYNTAKVTNIFATATINGTSESSRVYVGGMTGYNSGELKYIFFEGSVHGKSDTVNVYVGGIAGIHIISNLSNIFVVGNLSAISKYNQIYLGDIFGYFERGRVEYSVAVIQSKVYQSGGTSYLNGITGQKTTSAEFLLAFTLTGGRDGTRIDVTSLVQNFFIETLKWSLEIWDFTGLDIPNGVYPTLKNMPEIPVEE